MSAIVCGKRSNYFEDLQSSPPPVSKRIRFSSSSPVCLSPPRSAFSAGSFSSYATIDLLVAHFPEMDKQFLEHTLEECGNDLNSAIKRLNELRLSSVEISACSEGDHVVEVNFQHSNQDNHTLNNDHSVPINPSIEGAAWVDLFVREMTSAYNIDDAKVRASRALEALERSIHSRVTAEASQNLQQEIDIMKQQLQELMHENSVLKRAVSIQHERQKEYEDRSQEVVLLKQRLSQYQEQLKTLEVNNFALSMHLKASQQGSLMPGRFHPDIF